MIAESGVTLRRDLSAVANEFDDIQAREMFIGLRAAPVFRVGEESAYYPVICRETFRKPAETERASDGSYNRVSGEFGSGTYSCEEHGLEYLIDDKRRKRYQSFFDAESAAVRILRHQILMAQERRISSLILDSSTFTANSVSTAWATVASSVPLTDVTTGCETLEDNCGIGRENYTLIVPRTEYKYLCTTDSILGRIKYVAPGVTRGMLTTQLLAEFFGIKQVLVAGGSYDSAGEGVAESMSQIWSTGYAMLCVIAGEGDPLEMPSIARTMLWAEDSPENVVVETYRDEKRRSDVVRMRHNVDEVLTADADLLGYLLSTT